MFNRSSIESYEQLETVLSSGEAQKEHQQEINRLVQLIRKKEFQAQDWEKQDEYGLAEQVRAEIAQLKQQLEELRNSK